MAGAPRGHTEMGRLRLRPGLTKAGQAVMLAIGCDFWGCRPHVWPSVLSAWWPQRGHTADVGSRIATASWSLLPLMTQLRKPGVMLVPHALGCKQVPRLPGPRRKDFPPPPMEGASSGRVWGGRLSGTERSKRRNCRRSPLSVSTGGMRLRRTKSGGAAPRSSQEWRGWRAPPDLTKKHAHGGQGLRDPCLGTLFARFCTKPFLMENYLHPFVVGFGAQNGKVRNADLHAPH